MSVEIRGMDEVLDKMEKLGEPEKLISAIQEACAIVEASAKKKAPKDTGALRRSIASKVEESDGNIQGVVYTPLEYAPYIEYGTGLFAEKGGRQDVPWNYKDDEGNWHKTSGQKPRSFMRPALNENREDIMKKIKGALKDD